MRILFRSFWYQSKYSPHWSWETAFLFFGRHLSHEQFLLKSSVPQRGHWRPNHPPLSYAIKEIGTIIKRTPIKNNVFQNWKDLGLQLHESDQCLLQSDGCAPHISKLRPDSLHHPASRKLKILKATPSGQKLMMEGEPYPVLLLTHKTFSKWVLAQWEPWTHCSVKLALEQVYRVCAYVLFSDSPSYHKQHF